MSRTVSKIALLFFGCFFLKWFFSWGVIRVFFWIVLRIFLRGPFFFGLFTGPIFLRGCSLEDCFENRFEDCSLRESFRGFAFRIVSRIVCLEDAFA